MDSLLAQFLQEEATPFVRELLADAIADHVSVEVDKFSLNRFDVTIDFTSQCVVLDDVVDYGSGSTTVIALKEFVRVLDRAAASG